MQGENEVVSHVGAALGHWEVVDLGVKRALVAATVAEQVENLKE